MKKKKLFKNLQREMSLIVGLIGMIIIFSIISPMFLTPQNLRDIVEQAVIYGLMGVGMTYVIISGGIDLSAGSIVALTGVSLSLMLVGGMNIALAIIITLIIGIFLGFINGFLVAKMTLQPFIATMGTMSLYRGIAYVITGGYPISGIPTEYRNLVYGEVIPDSGIRGSIVIFICFAVIAALILRKTKFGSYVYALGGNQEAARLSGIRIDWNKFKAYMVCGIGSTLAAIVLIGKLGAGEPTAADGYELDAIAAAAIGGTSMAGGRGTILGTFIGAILFSTLKIGLIVSGMDSFWQYIATGLVIIVAAYVEVAQSKIAASSLKKKKA